MSPGALLAILALLVLVASLPVWPWSRAWSYRPSILLAIVFTLIVVLWATAV